MRRLQTTPTQGAEIAVGPKAIPADLSTWAIKDCAGISYCAAVPFPVGSSPGVRLFNAAMVHGADGIDFQMFTRADTVPLDRLAFDQYLAGFQFLK